MRGPYALQAAIASLQAEERLDWPQIAALYGELADRTGSAVVRLNRAVAIAEADGPAAALAIVDGLDLPGYQYWHSTRAELLRRLGRADEARAAYREALALARTIPERRFLERRIAETYHAVPSRPPARRAGDREEPYDSADPPLPRRWARSAPPSASAVAGGRVA